MKKPTIVMVLSQKNKHTSTIFFQKLLDLGIDFNLQKKVSRKSFSKSIGQKIIEPLPKSGQSLTKTLAEFKAKILPYAVNPSSPNFMGFAYAGNATAALGGAILDPFLQQNLIKTDLSPSATFAEIAVIQWLREIVGYQPQSEINSIWDVGGVVTAGGTSSNTIAILLARENKSPQTMEKGVRNPKRFGLIVPQGITHYSIAEAQKWCGCGDNVVEVETNNFRMNLKDLKRKLYQNKGNIMAVVAFAGDSKTLTIDNLESIASTVKNFDKNLWLHADACHGFSLGFSDKLRQKIKGLELFDSISADPHKVLNIPYPLSFLLVKNPEKMKLLASQSTISRGNKTLSLGRMTPFYGTKSWMSLKLWFLIKNVGKIKLGEIIDKRCETARFLAKEIKKDPEFILLNKADVNAVLFFYKGKPNSKDVDALNKTSLRIIKLLTQEGKFHLHCSKIKIPKKGKTALLRPLRYMGGNPNTTRWEVISLIKTIKRIGQKIARA